ncbi:hypothetical protein [Roseomonas marmotae]|uniref:Stress-induced protein n=1 Tax=Roseomonas marmotae TaxID=2768161 RepID=A0ABS3K8L3_9PROT|nr:hypothetical protein [Roseomonas marmotae]MBO1073807.1 hypothetical protein [Roseomonas marmotae]QTI78563.1 hypothetical protein IAI58_12885 [Roseomonas marmotae]
MPENTRNKSQGADHKAHARQEGTGKPGEVDAERGSREGIRRSAEVKSGELPEQADKPAHKAP